MGRGQLSSVRLREHRHLGGFLEDSTLLYNHSFLEPRLETWAWVLTSSCPQSTFWVLHPTTLGEAFTLL